MIGLLPQDDVPVSMTVYPTTALPIYALQNREGEKLRTGPPPEFGYLAEREWMFVDSALCDLFQPAQECAGYRAAHGEGVSLAGWFAAKDGVFVFIIGTAKAY